MKTNTLFVLFALLLSAPLFAQYGAVNGYCNSGATHAKTQGLNSLNLLQGEVPSCTVNVYITGTSTLATIYSNSTGTPISNPFTALVSGKWVFYASSQNAYDIVLSGGVFPNQFQSPVTISDVSPSIGAGNPFIACIVNDQVIAGSSCYPTITSAVAEAVASNRCIYIPSTYNGTDTYVGPAGYLCGQDDRHGVFGFYHYITPSYPVTGFPLGNDAVYGSQGPADTYIGPNIPGLPGMATTTSSTAMTAGVNATITVANMCTVNGANAFSPNASLLISEGAADYEAVGTFTLVNCTTINFTPVLSHAAGFGIAQDSFLHLRNKITFSTLTPPGPALGYTLPAQITDTVINPYLLLPGHTTDAFPHNVIRANTANSGLVALFTGFFGEATGQPTAANLTLSINSSSSFCTLLDASTQVALLSLCDAYIGFGKPLTDQTSGGQVAESGAVRLLNSSSIAWRNAANNADLNLLVNSNNQLWFNPSATALLVAENGIGVSPSLGGSALAAGACDTTTLTITSVTAGMPGTATASDGSYQPGFTVTAFGSGNNTAEVALCAIVAGTPTAKTYNVRIFQ